MTTDELRAIEARANAATSIGVNERGPWVVLADVPALIAAVRERDAEIARLRGYETIVNKMLEERQREALESL